MSTTTTTTTATTSVAANGSSDKPADFFEEVHFLGDAEGKIKIRSPPKFASQLDERKYQKQHLAAAFRVFAKQGFDEGVAGHISLRDPINPRKFSPPPIKERYMN
jgi:Class II Aldolase and Adducin N-terminal domain